MTSPQGALDRRQFLRGACASLAGVSLTAMPGLGVSLAEEPGGFVLGVQSYTFRNFDLEPALKRIQACGVRSAEFYRKHIAPESSPAQIQAFLKLCQEYEVTPRAWGVQRFSKDHDASRRLFEFGKALGIEAFSADPDPDSFDSLDRLCEEYRIAVAIHPHGPVGGKLHRWYSAEAIMKGVKDHHPLIGACLDTGHLLRAEQLGKKLDPAEEVRTMGARNFGMHLKDHDNKLKRDVIFGQGSLDVLSILKALREVKFRGMISIEYEANPEEPSEDVKACVAIFNKAASQVR